MHTDVPGTHRFFQLQSKHVVMDDTGRAAKERVSGELSLEKAFGAYLRVVNTINYYTSY